MAKLSLIVNGRRTGVEADPETPLLYATGLRLRRVPFSTASLKARLGSV